MTLNLIFPHQLFKNSQLLENNFECYLVEEWLYFKQYKFHKQKIAYHRASMKWYESHLNSLEKKTFYIESTNSDCDIRLLLKKLHKKGLKKIQLFEVVDNWLHKRITETCLKLNIEIQFFESPQFINSSEETQHYFTTEKKKFQQSHFYTAQRKKLDILVTNGKPTGGKWSYDHENRKKYPRNKIPPSIQFPDTNKFYTEAKEYTLKHFSDHLGEMKQFPLYPISFKESENWLDQFLEQRFIEFGPYEDAIVSHNSFLNHSILTPMLNIGLLTPKLVIEKTLDFAATNEIPLNSTEGFIRQIIGWREFMRGMYVSKGTASRTSNFWNHTRKIPASFYNGTTGIPALDTTIKKVLATGYCHHIERLMVLGNFMLLCEFDPKEVYRWFMELFIDAYDWVMVPNVYGMSQFADGGFFATKPYISGSNYILKMSDYKKGDWQEIWDGLFWNFMDKNRTFFEQNPRIGMLLRMFDKMDLEKRTTHLENASVFLNSLD